MIQCTQKLNNSINTKYASGSVQFNVQLHCTVIELEQKQMFAQKKRRIIMNLMFLSIFYVGFFLYIRILSESLFGQVHLPEK